MIMMTHDQQFFGLVLRGNFRSLSERTKLLPTVAVYGSSYAALIAMRQFTELHRQ